MTNIFLNLPMPVANGAGVSIDTSAMGKDKSIIVGGSFPGASISVEVSTDGVVFQPITGFTFADKKVISVVAQFMRVNVSGRGTQPFSAVTNVGANNDGAFFAALTVPVVDGPGVPVDVSTLGNFTTFVAGGDFAGTTIEIQASEDGVTYSPCASFAGQGDVHNREVVAQFMRTFVRGRAGNASPFTPTVAIGAAHDPGVVNTVSPGGITRTVLSDEDGIVYYQEINEGQIKIESSGGIKPSANNFVDGVAKILKYDQGALDLTTPPTTQFPYNQVGADSDIVDPVTFNLLENPLPGAVNIWRINYTFSGKAPGSNFGVVVGLANPLSSFVLSKIETLPAGTSASLLVDFGGGDIRSTVSTIVLITIADGLSIGTGYELFVATTISPAAAFTVEIESIVRTTYLKHLR